MADVSTSISTSDVEWALKIFRQTLQASEYRTESELPLDDPEKLKYLQDLIKYILDGRTIVASYNLVLLVILLIFAIFNFYQNVVESRKWAAIEGDVSDDNGPKIDEVGHTDGAESSSSSTLDSYFPAQPILKPTDVERQPLLSNRPNPSRLEPSAATIALIRSWLTYQPRPIPVINRTLPSNGTSLLVISYFGLNIFIQFFQLPLEQRYFFAFADRAGYVFVVNLPLLYLLAAKNQPLKRLTGLSYEALNIYHRRVGEWMCLVALVHLIGMVIWRLYLTPDWLIAETLWEYFTHPLILLGFGAFASYELLYFTSLASFRNRWYELFLASHVTLQIAALSFLWLHFYTSRPYVLAALAIFLLDRVVWRIGFKSATVTADIKVLEDGDTVLLSANWDLPPPAGPRKTPRFSPRSIIHGWLPADHIFITIPTLGGSHNLQAHPFTIASAAPNVGDGPAHAWLNLLIRAHSGFTSDLLTHARLNATVSVRIDGPYGSQDPLNMLRASQTAILIAGGSGIAVVFPLLWDLVMVHRGPKRKIHLLWIMHSRSQRSWMPQDRLDELRRAGVRVTIPPPTVEVGRPDIAAYVADVVAASPTAVGVVVSGPNGLNRSVRNACAHEIRSGVDINLRVEKFGW